MVPQSQGLGRLRNGRLKKSPENHTFQVSVFQSMLWCPIRTGIASAPVPDTILAILMFFELFETDFRDFRPKIDTKTRRFSGKDLKNGTKRMDTVRVSKVSTEVVCAVHKWARYYYHRRKRIGGLYCCLGASGFA